MYKLPKQLRDTIIAFNRNVVVSSQVGYNLIQIADALEKLEEIKENDKKKTDTESN